MQNILTIYEVYREKKPVMLFDMQEQRIYVYPSPFKVARYCTL